jgi:hypothetical protein
MSRHYCRLCCTSHRLPHTSQSTTHDAKSHTNDVPLFDKLNPHGAKSHTNSIPLSNMHLQDSDKPNPQGAISHINNVPLSNIQGAKSYTNNVPLSSINLHDLEPTRLQGQITQSHSHTHKKTVKTVKGVHTRSAEVGRRQSDVAATTTRQSNVAATTQPYHAAKGTPQQQHVYFDLMCADSDFSQRHTFTKRRFRVCQTFGYTNVQTSAVGDTFPMGGDGFWSWVICALCEDTWGQVVVKLYKKVQAYSQQQVFDRFHRVSMYVCVYVCVYIYVYMHICVCILCAMARRCRPIRSSRCFIDSTE